MLGSRLLLRVKEADLFLEQIALLNYLIACLSHWVEFPGNPTGLKKKFYFNNKAFICRSNTSILAQKKKNQKKKANRKRALDRRHSEGSESEKHDDEFDEKVCEEKVETRPSSAFDSFVVYIAYICSFLLFDLQDDDDDVGSFEHVSDNMKSQQRDSGVDLSENSRNVKIKNRKSIADHSTMNGSDIHFKSGMIFDLEM